MSCNFSRITSYNVCYTKLLRKTLKSKGAKYFGIHSFLASNTVANEYYPKLAKILFELAVELRNETGVEIKFINLSGGVGVNYKPDQEPNDIMEIGEGVRQAFEEVLVPAGMGDVAIFTELGRYMLAPYGHLVTKVIHEKHVITSYSIHYTKLYDILCIFQNQYRLFEIRNNHFFVGLYLVL